ncbi:DUF3558 domain-containing protein [Streptomyces sp. NPDC020794]|uniref:DUF3558 domain-containing protein n=1 Tax=unclassified Streptomyces TaxID=2593676 RepID=UPI0036E8077A
MHRPAQRVGRAPRLTRILVSAAAVPVVLAAAGCSSDSGSGSGSGSSADNAAQKGTAATSSASPSTSADAVKPAAYATLPAPCSVFSKNTLGELVPKGAKSAKSGKSDDAKDRSSCSWNSLDNKGVKGSQFRWLNVSLLRFDSDATRGEGNQLAQTYYDKQVKDAQTVTGATGARSEPVSGIGDASTAVRYGLKKKEGSFKQQTVVTRVENVVITLDYNGAGLAGDKAPSADDLTKAAEKAAKEAVAAVASANQDGSRATTAPSQSASPSKSASPSASAGSKPSASASATKKN